MYLIKIENSKDDDYIPTEIQVDSILQCIPITIICNKESTRIYQLKRKFRKTYFNLVLYCYKSRFKSQITLSTSTANNQRSQECLKK